MPLPSYDIDFRTLIKQLLAILSRLYLKSGAEAVIRIGWLKALTTPIQNLHTAFLAFASAIIQEIKWNGQTIILEGLLCFKFGAGIYITNNGNDVDGFFIGDGNDVSTFIGTGNDVTNFIDVSYEVSLYNFTVNVPAAIVFSMTEMTSTINKYKMFGTTYNIVIV